MRKDYPELWQELARIDAKAPNTFKEERSIKQYERIFALEDMQIKLLQDYPADKLPVCKITTDELKRQYMQYAVKNKKNDDYTKLQGKLF